MVTRLLTLIQNGELEMELVLCHMRILTTCITRKDRACLLRQGRQLRLQNSEAISLKTMSKSTKIFPWLTQVTYLGQRDSCLMMCFTLVISRFEIGDL